MQQVEKQLLKFNDIIRLDYDTSEELREKRDVLINKLKSDEALPPFETFNQGSYAMHTGVEPIDKEYDIDVGILFKINKKDYEPIALKRKVKEILENHTDYGAEIKRPCVTVTYKKNGERAFHVDLAIYAYEDKQDTNSQLYLAKGKTEGADDEGWEKSDPKGLNSYIGNIVDEARRKQFQRIVRYIKRWKNLKFSPNGNAEPPSIGLTILLHDHHRYSQDDDLGSMYDSTQNILKLFTVSSYAEDGHALYRLICPMPFHLQFECGTDAFAKMTDLQMTTFKEKLELFADKLNEALNTDEPVKQCRILKKIFGEDFPSLESSDVYEKQTFYIPSSSSSGM